MNNSRLNHYNFLAALCSLAFAPQLSAQSNAFTYQGRLAQNGSPYSGPAEMQFTLFDVPSGAVAIATNASPAASIQVNDGLFIAVLDFGVGAFSGEPRWLEVALRTNGNSAFTTLAPRQ